MNIAVFGSTGGTGRATVASLLAAGHGVTAFARQPALLADQAGLRVAKGDVTNPDDVARAVAGQDAVVVSLGLSRSGRSAGAATRHVCETGTRNIIAAMTAAHVSRLVCVTAYGVGDTRERAPLAFRIFFRLVMPAQVADKERQEALVKASGLDWTLVQPVGLTDKPASFSALASPSGEVRRRTVSRADVADVIVRELGGHPHPRATIVVSG
jgi:uncharacterized protein YbjT (DUF2867 family)